MNIIKSSAHMKSKPSISSLLETECLFGETIEILDVYLNWVYCKLTTDSYHGWVEKKNIGKLSKATHKIINIRSFVYKDSNIKSGVLLYLPLGSNLAVEEIKSGWAKIIFPVNNIFQTGYVPAKHLVTFKHQVSDWVAIAQSLEGTPYKWGGRDTIGLDCSSLLQLSYQTYGQVIPRNTSDQVNLEKPNIKEINDLKRGCVIFWEGHVGIMIDKLHCIHANAYHMKTITEPLADIINRTNKDHRIIKMMNFN